MGELLGGTLDARQLDLVRSDGSDAPESFVSRNPTLTKLLPLRDQVFAIGSDNAANVQAAVGMMNKEYVSLLGVVCRTQSHVSWRRSWACFSKWP